MPTSIAVLDGNGTPQTVATNDALAALIGEVQASPTANSLLDRLKSIVTALALNHTDESQLHTDIATTLHADLTALHTDLTAATPAGTNVIGKVTTDQTTHGTTDLVAADLIKIAGAAFALGQALAAASLPVVLPAAQEASLKAPVLAAGTAIVGKVGIDQTTPGTTNLVTADITKVAGAAISQGHGTAATAVRVELPTDGTGTVGLIAGTAVIGAVKVDQTTPGTTDRVTANIDKIAGAAISQGHGTAAAAIRVELPTDSTGVIGATQQAATAGGATPYSFIAAAGANQDSTVVKNGAGQVYGGELFNTSAAARYVKLYDKATGPTSADTPIRRYYLPAGGGSLISPFPKVFASGISFRITTGVADNDANAATANDVLVNLDYK